MDAAEISRQPGVDRVVWLLVIALMQIFNEEEGEQANDKMYSLRRRSTRKCLFEPSSVFKETKHLRKSLMLN